MLPYKKLLLMTFGTTLVFPCTQWHQCTEMNKIKLIFFIRPKICLFLRRRRSSVGLFCILATAYYSWQMDTCRALLEDGLDSLSPSSSSQRIGWTSVKSNSTHLCPSPPRIQTDRFIKPDQKLHTHIRFCQAVQRIEKIHITRRI